MLAQLQCCLISVIRESLSLHIAVKALADTRVANSFLTRQELLLATQLASDLASFVSL